MGILSNTLWAQTEVFQNLNPTVARMQQPSTFSLLHLSYTCPTSCLSNYFGMADQSMEEHGSRAAMAALSLPRVSLAPLDLDMCPPLNWHKTGPPSSQELPELPLHRHGPSYPNPSHPSPAERNLARRPPCPRQTTPLPPLSPMDSLPTAPVPS